MKITKKTGVSVREVLSLPAMKDVKILGGEGGLDKIINSIDIMEEPNIFPFVRDGQLLLTTAYGIKDDLESQIQLIPKLNKRKLSGLMVKLSKGYILEKKEQMIDAANKYSFPLLEMPESYSHATVIDAIYSLLYLDEGENLKTVEEVHQKLMQTVMNDGDINEICKSLYSICQNPISIMGADYSILGSYPKSSWSGKNLNIYLKKQQEEVSVGGRFFKVHYVPVEVRGYNYGKIIILEVNRKVNDVDIAILERSATLASISIMNQIILKEMKVKHKNDFLFEWMEGTIKSEKSLQERGKILALDLNTSFDLILLKVKDYKELITEDIEGSFKFSHIKEMVRSSIINSLQKFESYYVMADKGDVFLILLSGKETGDHKQYMKAIAESIYNEVQNQTIYTCYIGIGKYRENLIDLQNTYNEAKKAIEVAQSFHQKESILHIDDLGLVRLFMQFNPEETKKFISDYILPLINYDLKNKTDLAKTLEIYFKYHGNVNKVAKEMFTHYNTITYRIERVQQITETNINVEEDRLCLQLALKIYLSNFIES